MNAVRRKGPSATGGDAPFTSDQMFVAGPRSFCRMGPMIVVVGGHVADGPPPNPFVASGAAELYVPARHVSPGPRPTACKP